MRETLRGMVSPNETIYYEGKPSKACFIFESIFNVMLPVAVIWAAIDMGILLLPDDGGGFDPVLSAFFLFHMIPVWIYLAGVLTCFSRYRKTYYIVTDHAVYVSGGILNWSVEVKPFAELSRVNLHRGVFDQMLGVGDVVISTNQGNSDGKPTPLRINSISEYEEVYQLVKKLQTDIHSDIMYPNDLRPEENHGYRTKYRG